MKVLSLCDGMGTGKLAFDALGIHTDYWAVEINESARTLCDYNIKGIKRPTNDVLKITPRMMFEDFPVFDYVLFGFSCKSLSRQSGGSDLDGASKILFDCMSVLAMAQFRNPKLKFLIENVASMDNSMKEVIDEIIGVKRVLLNSGLVSGQGRERLYWCNWDVTLPEDRGIDCNSVLEYDAAELKAWSKSSRYRDKDGKVHSAPGEGRERYSEERFRTDNKANTLVTGKGCRGQSTRNYVVTIEGLERDLTVRECARLQTIPEHYKFDVVSDKVAYDCLGNGWTLEIIKHLLGHNF